MKILAVWSGWYNPRRLWEIRPCEYLTKIGNEVFVTAKTQEIPFEPDVVFSTNNVVLARSYSIKFRVPLIAWIIAGFPIEREKYKEVAEALLNADLLLAVSKIAREDFVKSFPYDVEDKLKVCYHGIDTDEADKVGNVKVEDVFTFVGNPQDGRKRFEWFREIINLSGVAHRIISPDLFEVEKFGLATVGTYHINVEERRKFELLKSSYALICASSWETFYLPGAECAYVKTPLLSYDLPVIREIWEDSVLYFQDVDEAVWMIWEMLEFPKIREKYAEKMHKQFHKKKLSLYDCAKRLQKYFEGVLE